jgi:hypothetical protein
VTLDQLTNKGESLQFAQVNILVKKGWKKINKMSNKKELVYIG